MAMVFCRGCGKEIHDSAPTCPQCGAPQAKPSATAAEQPKWYDKTWVVTLWLLFFAPVGLYALWKNSKIKKGWKIFWTVLISLVVLSRCVGGDKHSRTSSGGSPSTGASHGSSNASPKNTGVGVGQVLKTDYFEIVANRVTVDNSVRTGNEFADLKGEEGNKYLVINATFKNIDTESRMLVDGSVWISYNGKELEFDKSETIMLDGWGLCLDQINPLTKKTTNLVYKIPAELKGVAYWQPGRASSDERIKLGEIN